MKKFICVFIAVLLLATASSCAFPSETFFTVMLEENPAFSVTGDFAKRTVRGGSVSFDIVFNDGYYYKSCNADAVFEDGVLTVSGVRTNIMLVVAVGVLNKEHGTFTKTEVSYGVNYFATPDEGFVFVGWYDDVGGLYSYANNIIVDASVNLSARFVDAERVRTVTYHSNGGKVIGSGDSFVTVAFESEVYLYPASLGSEFFSVFSREEYFPIEYNYCADGSGEAVSLGSRVLCDGNADLYIMWEKFTPTAQFTFEVALGEASIVAYNGDDKVVVIPERYGDYPITRISSDAFKEKSLEKLIITPSVEFVADGAFIDCHKLKTLYLCDGIRNISDGSFIGSENLSDLRMIAVIPPTYTDNLVGTFVRRIEKLYSLRSSLAPSVVFYGGSGLFHSIDGATLYDEFKGKYNVINAGQNVNVCGPFMMEVLSAFMRPDDIFVYVPEYNEMIYSNEWTVVDWIAIESFYDALRYIDIRGYKAIIDSFSRFQRGDKSFSFPAKLEMKPKSYYDFNTELDGYFTRNYIAEPIEDNYLRVRTVDFAFLEKCLPVLERVYEEKCLSRGIVTFFAHSAMYEKAYSNFFTEFEDYTDYLKANLSFAVITEFRDFLFPLDCIYDEVTHLTTDAAIDNSIVLATAVKEAIGG